MAGHVVNPSTKFEDPVPIRSWVMSSDISHRIPLTMRLQPLRMRRITWPTRRGKFSAHIWNLWHRFAYPLHNFYGATIKTDGVIRQNSVWPCVKDHTALCAALNVAVNFFTTIVLGDHDFPLTASNFGNFTVFWAIFSYIFSAHAHKRLFMNIQLKRWHHHSIPWPRFLCRARYFDDLRTFSVDFCIDKLNVRHISNSGLVDLLI